MWRLDYERSYFKNDLLCIKSLEVDQHALSYHRCVLCGSPSLNKEGELEIKCNWRRRFKINIKSY